MRLLVLANSRIWAGAEVFLWRLCREFRDLGIAVVAVCPPGSLTFRRFRELQLEACYELDLGTPAGRVRGLGSLLLAMPGAPRGTRQLLRRMRALHDCDTVLCQYPREQRLTAEVARGEGYRSVWITHSQLFHRLHRVYTNRLLRTAILKVDAAFVISENTRRILIRQGFPANSLVAIPAAIDPPQGRTRTVSAKHRIGVVSRLNHNKGVQDILRAVPEILKRFPGTEVVVAGSGRYRTQLEKLVRDLRITAAVRFLGFVSDPEQVYSEIDVLAHAPFDPGDSMPLAILEAAAAGVPCVATDWAGIGEMVKDGTTGILVPPRDVNSIAIAIEKLLSNSSLRSRMGAEARRHVLANYTTSAIAARILEVLSQRGIPIDQGSACVR